MFTMFELYYFDNIETDTHSLGDAEQYDKEEREEIIYNAIDKYFSEHPIVINNSSVNTRSVSSSNDDLLDFSSSTDAKLYTVGVVGDAPTSSAQQTTLYLLDTRNILLIFSSIINNKIFKFRIKSNT